MTYTSYYLYFESNPTKGYIGITSNLSRRIRQHKSESKQVNKTKKHRWINKHLKTEELKYTIISSYNTWDDAVLDEPKLIQQYKDSGYILVNLSLGGEGNQGATGKPTHNRKEYVIIKDAKIIYVAGLQSWCKANKLSHGNLHKCLKGKLSHAQGYIVYFKDVWDSFSTEEQETILDSYYSTIAWVPVTEHLKQYVVKQECTLVGKDQILKFDNYTAAIAYLKCGVGTFYAYKKTGKLLKGFKIVG